MLLEFPWAETSLTVTSAHIHGDPLLPPSLLQPACRARLQTWSAAMRDVIPVEAPLIKRNLSLLSMDAEGGAEAGA